MNAITYKLLANGDIAVRVDGRKVGEIRLVPHGFRYYPRSGEGGGEIFGTLAQCKESLEEE